jgi:DNA-binding response OmpR family regulator
MPNNRSNLDRDVSRLAEAFIRDLTALVFQAVHELLLHSLPGGEAIPIVGAHRHRSTAPRAPAELGDVKPLKVAGLRIEPDSQTVQLGARKVRLTRSELRVFAYLARHRGKWVASNRLRRDVLGEAPDQDSDSPLLRVHIRNIRKKLGPAASKLVSKRRQGFMLR